MALRAILRTPKPKVSDVLELRVHGVDNTTASSLLDLRPEDVERIAGDKLGSFWRPTDAALEALQQGQRGYVPPGIVREAYSWGGMVRTTPDLGRAGAAGIIAATAARAVYALILPFAIGNAVQWSRRISSPTEGGGVRVWAAVTAGASRLFGLLLTMLFAATAITVSIDVLASQCAASVALCAPISGILEPLAAWSPGQRFALFALGPVVAVLGLWAISAVASVRYDVLPGMEWHGDRPGGAGEAGDVAKGGLWKRLVPPRTTAPTDAPTAILSHPGFWSNRIVGELARAHLAAVILLTTAIVAVHAGMRWNTTCFGLGEFADCVDGSTLGPAFWRFIVLAVIASILLVATIVLVAVLPTMTIAPDERPGRRWHSIASSVLLISAAVSFGALEVLLLFFSGATSRDPERLYGGGMMVLAIVTAAAFLALTGVLWRPFAGRRHTGWAGCAPALFMTISLVVAVATSAIVVVTAGDWLNGSRGAAALVRHDTVSEQTIADPAPPTEVACVLDSPVDGLVAGEPIGIDCTPVGTTAAAAYELTVPSSYVAFGSLVVAALVVGILLALLAAIRPRNVTRRARAWHAPSTDRERIVEVDDGVLPVSQRALYRRIADKRTSAARLHLVEPLAGLLTVVLAIAMIVSSAWVWIAYSRDRSLLAVFGPLPPAGSPETPISIFLGVALPVLAWTGLLLVGVLAAGSVGGGQRPLGIAWDIACYLPRTGHPFGPPSYAERAVPEIAGRVFAWLREDTARRVVLSAHSMGGVLAVSALGLLASGRDTRDFLDRVRLLTFGVQLRAFFGRMLPELLGPTVLGTQPSLAPRAFSADPWSADFRAQTPRTSGSHAGSGCLEGTLLTGGGVRWISLWRLTDYLGFPAVSTSPVLPNGRRNEIDRFAEELDLSGYMVEVGTHSAYYRTPAYARAVEDLLAP